MPKLSIHGIGAPTPSGSSIIDAWVEYKGSRTTEVPAGEPFKIRARGQANIPGQTTGCETLITAKSDDGSIAQFDVTRHGLGGPIYDTGNMHLKYDTSSNYFDPIMPNRNITLRIKLWGNDHIGMLIPDISQW